MNLFVTGTDTGVGKTYVTALLLAELRRCGLPAAAMKPIACGADGRRDAQTYRRLMGGREDLDVLNPVYLRAPLAPWVAARLERRRFSIARIRSCYEQLAGRYRPVLVEGAGGLLVPVTARTTVADLARELRLPLLIVARLGLGTLNHTLLTVEAAQRRGLTVRGIILNDLTGRRGLAERTNPAALAALCSAPVLGVVPYRATQLPPSICDQLCDEICRENTER
ncbi:MAG: dethiobiotin synthase [Verrucomicrobiae bacterium]|nr:dethiobiotin synthase [Verrucomicrobiae bacterium]